MDNNALDFELARSVGEYFQLTVKEMDLIINEIIAVVKDWNKIAKRVGISKNEMDYMERAFRVKV
jgi:serine/threonine-protein kinase HipA